MEDDDDGWQGRCRSPTAIDGWLVVGVCEYACCRYRIIHTYLFFEDLILLPDVCVDVDVGVC
jgi:hypothetical protein